MEVCNGLTANWFTIVFNWGYCSTGLGLVSVLLVGDGDGREGSSSGAWTRGVSFGSHTTPIP